MSETSQTGAVAVLGNFSITLPAPNGSQLSVSGYVYADESQQSLNDRMDLCRQSLERQQRMMEIPLLEAQIEQVEKAKVDIEHAYVDLLERKKKTSNSLSSVDQANLKNYPAQVKSLDQQLEKARKKIADARAGV